MVMKSGLLFQGNNTNLKVSVSEMPWKVHAHERAVKSLSR